MPHCFRSLGCPHLLSVWMSTYVSKVLHRWISWPSSIEQPCCGDDLRHGILTPMGFPLDLFGDRHLARSRRTEHSVAQRNLFRPSGVGERDVVIVGALADFCVQTPGFRPELSQAAPYLLAGTICMPWRCGHRSGRKRRRRRRGSSRISDQPRLGCALPTKMWVSCSLGFEVGAPSASLPLGAGDLHVGEVQLEDHVPPSCDRHIVLCVSRSALHVEASGLGVFLGDDSHPVVLGVRLVCQEGWSALPRQRVSASRRRSIESSKLAECDVL